MFLGSLLLPGGNVAGQLPTKDLDCQGFPPMTMDKSLRVRRGSASARGVLSRAERITKLQEQERWAAGRSPLGLPKVRVFKMSMKKKKKAKEEGAEGTAAAGAKAPAAGGKKK
jgi:small basic protein (TIGR04137 family)